MNLIDYNNGTVTVTTSGGTAPYSFLLQQNGQTFTYGGSNFVNPISSSSGSVVFGNANDTTGASGLPAGDYTCQITDSNGCVVNTPTLTVQQDISATTTAAPTYTVTINAVADPANIVGSHPYVSAGNLAGSSYTIPGPTWSVTGFTFIGYDTYSGAPMAAPQYQPGDILTITGNVNLYARYQVIPTTTEATTTIEQFDVTYQVQPGQYSSNITGSHPSTSSVANGTTITLAGPSWQLDTPYVNWIFDGYAISDNLMAPIEYQPGDSYTVSGPVTFYARYSAPPTTAAPPATVVYHAHTNPSYVVPPENATVTIAPIMTGSPYTIAGPQYSHTEGYIFIGWDDYSGTPMAAPQYQPGDQINLVPGSTLNLYARYTIPTTTIAPTTEATTTEATTTEATTTEATTTEATTTEATTTEATTTEATTTLATTLATTTEATTTEATTTEATTTEATTTEATTTEATTTEATTTEATTTEATTTEATTTEATTTEATTTEATTTEATTTEATTTEATTTEATTTLAPSYVWAPYGNPNMENNGIGNWVSNDEGTTYQWQLTKYPGGGEIPVGQQIWWRVDSILVSGNPASPADFAGGQFPSGSFVTQTPGAVGDINTVALWSVALEADNLTESIEQYTMKLYSDSTYTTEIELSGTAQNYVQVDINDTSQATTTEATTTEATTTEATTTEATTTEATTTIAQDETTFYHFHMGGSTYPFTDVIGTGTAYLIGDTGYTPYPLDNQGNVDLIMTDLINNSNGAGSTCTPGTFEFAGPIDGTNGCNGSWSHNLTGGDDYYYLAVPNNASFAVDLVTDGLLQESCSGTYNASDRRAFTYNGESYWLYKMINGQGSIAKTFNFK